MDSSFNSSWGFFERVRILAEVFAALVEDLVAPLIFVSSNEISSETDTALNLLAST